MRPKWGVFFVALVLALILIPADVRGEPKVNARTAVLIDGNTGQILWGKDADKPRPPASTVKMLTILIALEQMDLSTPVTVGRKAHETYVGQTIGLVEGDILTVEDLAAAALLWSANDAAVALGEFFAGTPELFSFFMNYKAVALGALNSNFTNPNGYSEPGQYSTAYDLALIGRAAMQNSFIAETVKKKMVQIRWLNKKKTKEVPTTNNLLSLYPAANGIKTGTTTAAGGCLAGSAVRGNRWLVTVVLGSSRRYADTIALMEYGFNNFSQTAVQKNKIFGTIAVENGEKEKMPLVPRDDIFFTVPCSESEKLKIKGSLPAAVSAPVKKGQVLGHVKVFYDGHEVGRTDLVAGDTVKRKGLFF